MDALSMRLQTLERGHAVHGERIDQLERTDQRFGNLAKWALPIVLSLHLALNGYLASEIRALRPLVEIAARMEERLSATDRRVERIEARLETPAIMSE